MTIHIHRPLRADAERNRASIIAAARVAFARDGVDAPLDHIARSAAVSAGTLYRRFPSRSELVAAVLDDHFMEVQATAKGLLEHEDPAEALQEWIRTLADFASTYVGLPDNALSAGQCDHGGLAAVCRDLEDLTDTIVQRAQDSVHPDITGEDVFVLVNALAWADTHDQGRVRTTQRLATVLRGVLR